MILLFLTTVVPAAIAALPGLSRHAPILIDSPENCRFQVGPRQYDLCPIFEGKWPLSVKGEGVNDHRLGFDKAGSETSAGHLQCSPGTRICVTNDRSESHKAIATSIITLHSEESDEVTALQIAGSPNGANARVRLVCDPRAELGQPVFSGLENTLPSFTWRTKHACESGLLTSESILTSLDAESDDAPPADEPSEPPKSDEDSEQLLDGDKQRNSRRSTAVILLAISIIIVSISIISYKHPNRLNLMITDHIKPVFQRLSLNLDNLPRLSIPNSLKPAGENRLMRWAHEDLELDEDLMVNGQDVYDEPDEVGDEYIPLRPSPRKIGRGVKNYGSAPPSPFW